MIHFACVYCGAKVGAQDVQACRKAKCPACGHMPRVPAKRTADVEPDPSPPGAGVPHQHPSGSAAADPWAGKSNKQIAKLLLKKPLTPEHQERLATKRMLTPLLPQYDDLTLFALSAAFLLLPLTGPIAIDKPVSLHAGSSMMDVFAAFAGKFASEFTGLFLLAGLGMILSFFGAFFTWRKPRFVKFLMLSFAVFATGGTGVYAGFVMLRSAHGWLMMIFPLWNIINGAILLILFRAGLMDPDCVVDRKPSLWQILVTLVSISLLLAICRHGLNLHWAITYSICVCYTMSLNHTLQDLFGLHPEPLTILDESSSSHHTD